MAFKTEARNMLPTLSASDVLSMLFRQRGAPSLDLFPTMIVGAFRRAMKYDPDVEGTSASLCRW